MTDFINGYKAIHHFISGIFSKSKGEYTLTFVQDPDNRWFIDIPWDGNRDNLEMVAGADDLLSFFDKNKKHKVTLHVVPSDKPLEISDHIELRQIDKSLWGGSHYDATSLPDANIPMIWICPVTLCVLGCYPKYLYVRTA